jgi:hypothetical protein
MGFFKRIAQAVTFLYNSSGLVVWLTALIVAALIVGQKVLALHGITILLPLDMGAMILSVIVSGYVGTDRIASFVKTQSLSYGSADFGDVPKLRRMVFLMLALAAEAFVAQVFFGVTNAPLGTLLLGYGGTASTYVMGNKAIKAAAHIDGRHTIEEAGSILSSASAQQIPGVK